MSYFSRHPMAFDPGDNGWQVQGRAEYTDRPSLQDFIKQTARLIGADILKSLTALSPLVYGTINTPEVSDVADTNKATTTRLEAIDVAQALFSINQTFSGLSGANVMGSHYTPPAAETDHPKTGNNFSQDLIETRVDAFTAVLGAVRNPEDIKYL